MRSFVILALLCLPAIAETNSWDSISVKERRNVLGQYYAQSKWYYLTVDGPRHYRYSEKDGKLFLIPESYAPYGSDLPWARGDRLTEEFLAWGTSTDIRAKQLLDQGQVDAFRRAILGEIKVIPRGIKYRTEPRDVQTFRQIQKEWRDKHSQVALVEAPDGYRTIWFYSKGSLLMVLCEPAGENWIVIDWLTDIPVGATPDAAVKNLGLKS